MQPITVHSVQQWYMTARKRGERPKDALWSARVHRKAELELVQLFTALSPASVARVDSFVDDFIRGECVEQLTSERDSDFINEPERAGRCHDAAEFGADGKTHSEVIEDWRDAFKYWVRERKSNRDAQDPDRFTTAVEARFTVTELWHAFNGSLFEEIG